jgi:hypothetical protein
MGRDESESLSRSPSWVFVGRKISWCFDFDADRVGGFDFEGGFVDWDCDPVLLVSAGAEAEKKGHDFFLLRCSSLNRAGKVRPINNQIRIARTSDHRLHPNHLEKYCSTSKWRDRHCFAVECRRNLRVPSKEMWKEDNSRPWSVPFSN